MSDLHLQRDHHLGLPRAREGARAWARTGEDQFDMGCNDEEGDTQDTLSFTRAGVSGTLVVDAQQFDMTAKLGFLFSAFKDRIETEISGQLDELLGTPNPTSLA